MPRFTDEELRTAVAASLTWAETGRRLGYRTVGGNPGTVKRHAERLGLSTDHFDPAAARRVGLRWPTKPLDEVLVEGSTYGRHLVKRRLLEGGLKDPICEICGLGEIWRGERMALILDHINGTPDDHRIGNLRILCPNCAATLDTHCGRKNKVEPTPRPCQRCGTEFLPSFGRKKYCSSYCGQRWVRAGAGRPGVPRLSSRKVERPSYKQLILEIAQTSYVAVGRKYG